MIQNIAYVCTALLGVIVCFAAGWMLAGKEWRDAAKADATLAKSKEAELESVRKTLHAERVRQQKILLRLGLKGYEVEDVPARPADVRIAPVRQR